VGTQSASIWADRKWGESVRRSVVESHSTVLPLFSRFDADELIRSLHSADLDLALRHKLVRVGGTTDYPLYACVTDDAAFDATRCAGHVVVARIARRDFYDSVFTHFGARLERQAALTLARDHPIASARLRFSWGQIVFGCGVVFCAVLAAAAWGAGILLFAFNMLCSVIFSMAVALRVFCLVPAPVVREVPSIKLRGEDLPVYTVLVPLFKETAVVQQLVKSLLALHYPREKLDIKLLLEEHDVAMHEAVAALHLPEYFEVLVVPVGKPQTKPRALNYGLLFARGDLITIFDGEDIPEPQQLRLAAARFAGDGAELACVQAALTFYNPNENWLTRHFTAEYAALFLMILPQMARHGLPLPLGGTSNHFRVSAIRAVGGWDPFNVTEDADLGFRFAAQGFRCATLRSLTYEEANTEFKNWMMQRRRWLKGFLHTWLVQMRRPLHLARNTGVDGFWVVQAMSIGVFLSALLHPLWMVHVIWFFASGEATRQAAMPGQALLIAINVVILTLGYGAGLLLARGGLQRLGYRHWWSTLLTIPLYWMLMAPAAWLGLWDFIVRPHHWHKTRHGLSQFLRR
jgi:glycosyltransferase XagB